MSWGRGVHNEKLKRSQRLALASASDTNVGEYEASSGYHGLRVKLGVLQLDTDIELSLHEANMAGRQVAYCSPDDVGLWQLEEAVKRGECFIYVRTYPQVLQKIKTHADVPSGHIVLTEVQRQNLEVTRQDSFHFTIVSKVPDSVCALKEVCLDARPRYSTTTDETSVVVADGKSLARALLSSVCGLIASANGRYLVKHDGRE